MGVKGLREKSGDHTTFDETLPRIKSGTRNAFSYLIDGNLWNIPGYPQTSSNMIGRRQNSKPPNIEANNSMLLIQIIKLAGIGYKTTFVSLNYV